jgi:cytochrome c
MKLRLIAFGLAGLTVLASAYSPSPMKAPQGKAKISYSSVEPLIKAACTSCHNAGNHPEKVDLSSFKALMSSGEHGSIVIAGHPEKSKLILYVDGSKQPRMPFKKSPLTSAQIGSLKSWIKAGAKP